MRNLQILAATLVLANASAAFADGAYVTTLSGLNENPQVVTTGGGLAELVVIGNMLTVDVSFSNLTGFLADGHIHCCVASTGNTGVAIGFGGLPLGQQSGSFSLMFDLDLESTYRAAYITASGGTVELAKARLLTAFDTDLAYVNLHSTVFPGGEIRGQIDAVPEPASWALMIAGFGLVGLAVRRRATVTG